MSRLGTLTGPAPLRSGLDIHLERDIAGYHARKDSKRPEPLYKRESRFAIPSTVSIMPSRWLTRVDWLTRNRSRFCADPTLSGAP